jgi:hypothetical protein
MKLLIIAVGCSFLLFLAGCSAHTSLEPIGEKHLDVNLSVGGPVVKAFNNHIPIPYFVGGAKYGLTSDINACAGFHFTSLPYKLLGIELGVSYFPTANNGFIPTVGISPSILSFASLKPGITSRFRVYPTFTTTASWHVKNNLIFTGFDFTLPFTKPDYDDSSPKFIFSPFAGCRFELGGSFRLITEIKWQGANIKSNQIAVEYTRIAKYGAVAILFALERAF